MPMKLPITVVLISLYSFRYSAMGVRQLHRILADQGVNVHTVFFKPYDYAGSPLPSDKEYDLLFEKIEELAPDLVGISLYSTVFDFARRITLELRKRAATKIVWGGIHATICPEQCIEYADFVNLGEGYRSLPALVDNLRNEVRDIKLPNLWVRTAQGVTKSEIGALCDDLDSLPPTDYSDTNKYYINRNKLTRRNEFADVDCNYYVMSALGCPFHCTYCCNNVLRTAYAGKGSYIRRRSVGGVIAELQRAIQNPRIRFIEFWDDVFTMQREWLKAFCAEYQAKIGLPFFCYAHPAFLDDNIVAILAKAGLKRTTIGVQSGSEPFRRACYERSETDDRIREAGSMFAKHGIMVNYDFITGNPVETDEDKRRTFFLICSLPHPLTLAVSDLLLFPRHKLTERLLAAKVIDEEDLEPARKRALGRFGLIFDISNRRERYWNLLFVLAGYLKLPEWLKRFLLSGFFRHASLLVMVPFSWLVFVLFVLRHRIPKVYRGLQGLVFKPAAEGETSSTSKPGCPGAS